MLAISDFSSGNNYHNYIAGYYGGPTSGANL